MKPYQEVLNQLFKILHAVKPQPPELYEHLTEIMIKEFYNDGKIIFRAGHIIDKTFFFSDGYVLAYCANNDGEDVVVHIYGKNEIIAGNSFMEQSASPYRLVALPGAFMLSLTHQQMEEIYKIFPTTEELSRKLVSAREKENVEFHCILGKSALEKVRWFYSRYPELQTNPGSIILDQDIASYLGISVRSLRDCRKRL